MSDEAPTVEVPESYVQAQLEGAALARAVSKMAQRRKLGTLSTFFGLSDALIASVRALEDKVAGGNFAEDLVTALKAALVEHINKRPQ